MTERVEMTIKLQVTTAQGLAVQAMFDHWNRLAAMGASREVSFYVDGDGNFKPCATFSYSKEMPELTPEISSHAVVKDDGDWGVMFDSDGVENDVRAIRAPTQ